MIVSSRPQATVLRLRFRSEMERIPFAVNHVMGFVRQSGAVRGQEIEVELALREALVNAIVHGNRMDRDKWVRVRCECDPVDGIAIVIGDEGEGFDEGRLPDQAARGGLGRGLLVMRSCMDDVSFEKDGTEVHLHKDPAVARIRSIRTRDGRVPVAPTVSGLAETA
jgi:serine/threonine-protein kinase RsbW